ncbi:MAG: hypothetical protein BWY91_02803 [bacterium ADurb.BinA028]|nr:MAG: hypothetical protein BWY91_02803 [bacterium ADurb.BinA028]
MSFAATASFVTIFAAFRLPAVGATNATCDVVALTAPSGTMIARLFAVAESFAAVTLAFRIFAVVTALAASCVAPTVPFPMVPAPPGAQP